MASLNKIMVIGNVGKDPEMRFTPSGRPVTNFSLATNQSYTTSEGERKEQTEWFTIVAWGKLAEKCNDYIQKGRQVYAEGRFQSRQWEGQDGKTHYKSEIVADRVLFLGKREESAQEQSQEKETIEEIQPEDIPF